MSITVKELNALKPKDKPYMERVKSPIKGNGTLAFKVLPTGDIDAYFLYYIDRKERSKKIGRYKDMTLKEINEAYLELSNTYKKLGDVKEVERQQREQQAEFKKQQEAEALRKQMQGSLQQLIECYVESLAGRRSQSEAQKRLSGLDIDSTLKANVITKQHIIKILHPIVERGALVLANRTRSYLSAMFNFGIAFDDTTEALSKGIQFNIETNPVLSVKKPLKSEAPRDRCLSEEEVHQFWKALEASKMSPFGKHILMLMLTTGARVEALSGLKWSEIDHKEKLLTIPPERSKNGNHWVIPLNALTQQILENTPVLSSVYCFPANNGEVIRTDYFSTAVDRLCKQHQIEHFQPKDLRTTFKTLAAKAGIDKETRDRIQNHALNDVSSRHYDRYDYLKEKRAALDRWNSYLNKILTGQTIERDNVVVLKRPEQDNIIPMQKTKGA